MNMNDIASKIQKLLALGNNNPNENEAQAALLKAQELMAQYGIDVSYSENETKECALLRCEHKGNKGFRCQLASIIARNFKSRTILFGGTVAFLAYKQDAMVAKSAFEYAYKYAKKQGDKQVNEARKNGLNTKNVFNSYVAGFLRGLDSKLSEQCQALMIVTPKDVNDEFDRRFSNSKTYRGGLTANDSFDGTLYAKGFDDGRSVMDKRSLNA